MEPPQGAVRAEFRRNIFIFRIFIVSSKPSFLNSISPHEKWRYIFYNGSYLFKDEYTILCYNQSKITFYSDYNSMEGSAI